MRPQALVDIRIGRAMVALLLVLLSAGALRASTAAFAGKVVGVQDPPPNDRGCLRRFTVSVYYIDYMSWGRYGADTKVGETITRMVMPRGTVGILNGRLVNARTLAGAFEPGTWGYFYEDTWLDLFTTPDFQWGEVVAHDAARREFRLRVHYTHKQIHLDANPPKEFAVEYGADTALRLEDAASAPEAALRAGHWVQVHEPRPQMIDVRTEASAFDPAELLPAEEGQRGYANNLTAPAVLKSYRTSAPEQVIDLPAQVTVSRHLEGRWQDASLDCRKTTFILDGKVCPVAIAFRPGRHAVLGHYRKETSPHKIFVRSFDDAVRGTIKEVAADGKSLVVTVAGPGTGAAPAAAGKDAKPAEKTVALEADARVWLDGRQSAKADALKAGRDVAIHPPRGRTVIAFPPYGGE